MSNWYGAARSNYFRVKDVEAFEAWADERGLQVITQGFGNKRLYGIYPEGTDDGSWPSLIYDEALGEHVDCDIYEEIAAHLAEGEIAVLVVTGAEKLRYLTGCAAAVHSSGDMLLLSINDIYDLAKAKWGVEPTAAEY